MIDLWQRLEGSESARRALSDFQKRQLPFAQAVALNRTAKVVKESLVSEMKSAFDRPTRFTLNSLRTIPATKSKPQAKVWVKDGASKSRSPTAWLLPEVHGGDRNDKGFERALRGVDAGLAGRWTAAGDDAKLDAHGNLSRGVLQKILSSLGAQRDQYTNSTDSRRSAGNKKRFFVIRRGERVLGIAERVGYGPGSRNSIRMVVGYTRKPKYSRRLDFYGVAGRVVNAQLDRQLEIALDEAVLSAR